MRLNSYYCPRKRLQFVIEFVLICIAVILFCKIFILLVNANLLPFSLKLTTFQDNLNSVNGIASIEIRVTKGNLKSRDNSRIALVNNKDSITPKNAFIMKSNISHSFAKSTKFQVSKKIKHNNVLIRREKNITIQNTNRFKTTFKIASNRKTSHISFTNKNLSWSVNIFNKSIRIVDKLKINCKKIILDDQREIAKAEKLTKNLISSISNIELINLTQNCKQFLAFFSYAKKPFSKEESDFSLAYSLIVHKDASQVERLLRAIYWPQNYYCIHIDKKSPPDFHSAIKNLSKCFKNVIIASKLEKVVPLTKSVLQADLNCMKDLLAASTKWKYLINLEGHEFPLRTNMELINIFKTFKGSNDIQVQNWPKLIQLRTEYSHKLQYDAKKKLYKIVKTSEKKTAPPHNLMVYKGSRYGAFSRAFVKYIFTNKLSLDLLKWLNDTLNPAESYWSTLVANPHTHAPGVWNDTRNNFASKYVVWKKNYPKINNYTKLCKHGYYEGSVCIFGIRDLHDLSQRPHLFANKFYTDFQPIALECMEELLKNRTLGLDHFKINLNIYKMISNAQLYSHSILTKYFG